jgi:hypothetical protein
MSCVHSVILVLLNQLCYLYSPHLSGYFSDDDILHFLLWIFSFYGQDTILIEASCTGNVPHGPPWNFFCTVAAQMHEYSYTENPPNCAGGIREFILYLLIVSPVLTLLLNTSRSYYCCVLFAWSLQYQYYFGGLQCIGHSFAYVAHVVCLRDVWIRTQKAAVATHLRKLAIHLPSLATHLPTWPPISLLSHPSPYLATHLPTWPPISLLSHPSPYLVTQLPTEPPISVLGQ